MAGFTNVTRPEIPAPSPSLFPMPQEKYLLAFVAAVKKILSDHATAINNSGSGGSVQYAGNIAIVAPNTITVVFPVPQADAAYSVVFGGGYVGPIASGGLIPFGINNVNIRMNAEVSAQTAGGFTANVTWSAVDAATLGDQPFAMALPPQGTEWHSYANMAGAYGLAAPYNALATATGLNSIYYTVVDY